MRRDKVTRRFPFSFFRYNKSKTIPLQIWRNEHFSKCEWKRHFRSNKSVRKTKKWKSNKYNYRKSRQTIGCEIAKKFKPKISKIADVVKFKRLEPATTALVEQVTENVSIGDEMLRAKYSISKGKTIIRKRGTVLILRICEKHHRNLIYILFQFYNKKHLNQHIWVITKKSQIQIE